MNEMSQKNAVIRAVKKVLGSSYDSSIATKTVLTKDQADEIKSLVVGGILDGTIVYGKDSNNEDGVKKYVSGMVSNHLRKAEELNGGIKYSANPSKTLKNSELNALKTLLNSYPTGSDEFNKVVEEIDKKEKHVKLKKNKYDIDVTILSDDLKATIANEM